MLVATLLGIATPLVVPASPAVGDTTLGGYTAAAEAAAVRIGIFDPAIPLPSDPQVDVSLGFARSTTSTGPVARGLASYLWPGDVVGDGLGTVLGNDKANYPVKVQSKYPASDGAPAKNAAQLTDGNGMSTSADGTTTRGTVRGLGLGANLASGLGDGLCQLLGSNCPAGQKIGLELPTPIATIVSMENLKSQSTVTLGSAKLISEGHVTMSGLSLLAGLITIDGVDVVATATSDGARSSNVGRTKVVGLKVAGKRIDLGDPISVDGKDTPLPQVPVDLAALGIKIEYLSGAGRQAGPTASRAMGGLTITVDLHALSKVLGDGKLSDALAPVLSQIPQAGSLLLGLLKLGTKLVVTVGDARASATATPGYSGSDPGPPLPPTNSSGPVAGSGPVNTGVPLSPDLAPPADVPSAMPPVDQVPVAFQFPGLAKTPSLLILAGLVLAGLFGWLFRSLGAFVLGGDDCALGLTVGVPNLREG